MALSACGVNSMKKWQASADYEIDIIKVVGSVSQTVKAA